MRLGVIAATLLGILSICQPADGSNTRNAPVIEITLMGAGIVKIEGRHYSDAKPLRAELIALKKRHPSPELRIVPSKGISLQSATAAVELVFQTGEVKLGIVNTQE